MEASVQRMSASSNLVSAVAVVSGSTIILFLIVNDSFVKLSSSDVLLAGFGLSLFCFFVFGFIALFWLSWGILHKKIADFTSLDENSRAFSYVEKSGTSDNITIRGVRKLANELLLIRIGFFTFMIVDFFSPQDRMTILHLFGKS
jgi:hypothetical protein